jgi:hypothetical protein
MAGAARTAGVVAERRGGRRTVRNFMVFLVDVVKVGFETW